MKRLLDKNIFMMKLLLILFFTLTVFKVSAQQYTLSGQITNKKNIPVSFASVYIKNSTYGTTANENGDYVFKLAPGIYDVIYRFPGYKEKAERISINQDVQHNVQLDTDLFQLQKITKKENDANDPAMDIMHQVINKREFYLNEVKSYSCTVYIKGVKKIINTPKTLLDKGMNKILNLDTSGRGISYQSESLSAFNYEQPNKIKEEFIASKVAGVNPPFGYNKASDLQMNFYKNMFFVNELNNHGFVSPAGAYAFKYYKFQLLGTIVQDGKRIDKIQVISKIGKALSFSGFIYILEGDWRIYSVDLTLTNSSNNLNFVDTLRVSQQYIPVKNNTWMPLSFQYSYKGNVHGLKFSGYYLGIYNNYKLDTVFKPGYFTGEILRTDTAANKRTPLYWASIRPVPLTFQEAANYHKNDSLAVLQESKAYMDSVQHEQNKIKILPVLVHGYLATYKANKDSLFIYPVLQTVYYNTVEGWGVYLRGRYSKNYDDNRSFSISPGVRYGFANKLFSANMHSEYTYDQAHAGKFFLDFGSDVLDLNNLGTRSLYFNTLSTLLSEQNFVKYYRSVFGDVGYQRELANGILWMANLSYADRTQLYNTSYNHIFTYPHLRYTSNNPLAPDAPANDHSELFPQNQALIFNTSFRFTFDQQYMTRPTGKVYLPSLYPVVTVNYRKGINGVLGSDVDYDFVSLDITQDRIPMGLFGHSAFKIKAGGFLNRKTVYYMDYNHFLGNEGTTSDPTYVGSFHFVPFYTFSTEDPFVEVHYQHNFSGAILDNIPYLRRLKLEEIIGANYLTEKTHQNYTEIYIGLKRLIYGADYGVSYLGGKKYLQGFRIFIGLK
jgi:hypothetical protein